jgi:hypothetical protein
MERIGLRSAATLDPLGSIELDDELIGRRQMASQAGATASRALDREDPRPAALSLAAWVSTPIARRRSTPAASGS